MRVDELEAMSETPLLVIPKSNQFELEVDVIALAIKLI